MTSETFRETDTANTNWRVEVVTLALLTIVLGLIIWLALSSIGTPDSDYGLHAQLIDRFVSGQYTLENFLRRVPHFLYHLLVLIGYGIFPATDLRILGIGAAIVFYILGGWSVYFLARVFWGRPAKYRTGLFYAASTLLTLLVAPVTIFTPSNMYLGNMAINTYHNPTIIALKPFALLLFWLAGRTFDNSVKRLSLRWLGIYISITLVSILAKPNYVFVLLPSLVVMGAFYFWKRQHVDWLLLIVGIIIPSGVLLSVQALLLSSSTSIIFAPLAVVHRWAEMFNPLAEQVIPLKILLAVLFPLVVYLVYWKRSTQNVYLNLAWLGWVFGTALYYLFAEEGARLSHGNLTWSAQAAQFVLFAISFIFFVLQYRPAKDMPVRFTPALGIGVAALALHLISGLYWYYVHLGSLTTTEIIYTVW